MTRATYTTFVSLDGVSVTSRTRDDGLTGPFPGRSFPKGGKVPTDPAAVRALARLERGRSQGETVHDDDCPKQTPAELALFRRVSFKRQQVTDASLRAERATTKDDAPSHD